MSELKLRHILEPKTPNEWQLRWRMLSLLEERGVCAVDALKELRAWDGRPR